MSSCRGHARARRWTVCEPVADVCSFPPEDRYIDSNGLGLESARSRMGTGPPRSGGMNGGHRVGRNPLDTVRGVAALRSAVPARRRRFARAGQPSGHGASPKWPVPTGVADPGRATPTPAASAAAGIRVGPRPAGAPGVAPLRLRRVARPAGAVRRAGAAVLTMTVTAGIVFVTAGGTGCPGRSGSCPGPSGDVAVLVDPQPTPEPTPTPTPAPAVIAESGRIRRDHRILLLGRARPAHRRAVRLGQPEQDHLQRVHDQGVDRGRLPQPHGRPRRHARRPAHRPAGPDDP